MIDTFDSIIGIGKIGCEIAKVFKKQYSHVYLDSIFFIDWRTWEGGYEIEKRIGHEQYDEYEVDEGMKKYLSCCPNQVLIALSGVSETSGITLRLCEHLKRAGKAISILYIRPEQFSMTSNERKQENMTYNVLQEYARSGKFEKMWIIGDETVEDLLPANIPIREVYTKINETIVDVIHTINALNHTQPEFGTIKENYKSTRLATVGFANIDTYEEKPMYTYFSDTREKKVYFLFKRATIDTDVTLRKKIKQHVMSFNWEEIKVSWGVYNSLIDKDGKENLDKVLIENSSAEIQK